MAPIGYYSISTSSQHKTRQLFRLLGCCPHLQLTFRRMIPKNFSSQENGTSLVNGPQSPQGSNGPQSSQRSNGPQSPQGSSGPQSPQGSNGLQSPHRSGPVNGSTSIVNDSPITFNGTSHDDALSAANGTVSFSPSRKYRCNCHLITELTVHFHVVLFGFIFFSFTPYIGLIDCYLVSRNKKVNPPPPTNFLSFSVWFSTLD